MSSNFPCLFALVLMEHDNTAPLHVKNASSLDGLTHFMYPSGFLNSVFLKLLCQLLD